ncbi:PREDICTED: cytochrome P450 86B1-like [Camelina sativa]|uniref:Cytochrome P450 86B1-like n=1 Tax=Camelina sativa TaxID=90675 RepID=A0ABM0TA18_CAMSA|nr:PREDICTED: cytochrome P450 86B1-like [Camelina sativa]
MNSNSSAYNLTATASHHEPLFSRRLLLLRDVQILELFIALFVFVTIHSLRQKKHQGMPVWPFLGMLPSLILAVRSNIYEWLSDILISRNGTFRFRGPWFSTLNCVVTCDPRNVEHILKTRFSIYPKGSYFRETMRDLLGDGIFNADEETWQRQRKTASVEFHSAKFRQLTSHSLHELVHNRLLPVLEISEKIDLQDVLLRLTFDNVCMIAFGVDPGCLSPNLPEIPFAKAFEDATEATAVRFVMPGFVWKLMRSLNLGTEKNLKESIKGVDYFAEEVIRTRKKELSLETETAKRSDLLTIFMGLRDDNGEKFSVKFLRDICVNFILAGRDTSSVVLSWFFWLVEKNPEVEEKIMVGICKILEQRDDHGDTKKNMEYEPVFRPDEIKKMDYLQAALSEALRLYPSVPVDHKEVLEDDVFPDGTKLKKGEKVIYAIYAMARMETIWGKDCCEFKPERWLRDGRYTSESAYKFTAFNGGPRLCLGKDFAYYQMKYVAATIIYRYRVSVKGGHKVEPKMALTMYMKHGLKVNMVKRSASEIDHYYC